MDNILSSVFGRNPDCFSPRFLPFFIFVFGRFFSLFYVFIYAVARHIYIPFALTFCLPYIFLSSFPYIFCCLTKEAPRRPFGAPRSYRNRGVLPAAPDYSLLSPLFPAFLSFYCVVSYVLQGLYYIAMALSFILSTFFIKLSAAFSLFSPFYSSLFSFIPTPATSLLISIVHLFMFGFVWFYIRHSALIACYQKVLLFHSRFYTLFTIYSPAFLFTIPFYYIVLGVLCLSFP